MLANGSDLTTVDNLPLDDAKALYETLRCGLWGPYGETYRNYNLYLSAHMNKEVAVAVASGKKYKATKPIAFHELYPIVDDYMTLGMGKYVREVKTQESIAKRAMMSLPTDGAPAWLIAATKE
tara:strand:+ start:2892 stop:3260 length:369 start_codon:yes stop_codon:yes gene_type:complete